MKKKNVLILICIVMGVATTAYAKSFLLEKTIDDLTIKTSLSQDHPRKGKNEMMINLSSASGQDFSDSKISVIYYMKPKKGMQPMSYRTKAESRQDGYQATLNLMMPGTWYVNLKIRGADKSRKSFSFNFDVEK